MTGMWNEILTVLNSCSTPRAVEVLTSALHKWVMDSRNVVQLCAITTACSSLADIQQMTALCEACLNSYFYIGIGFVNFLFII